MPPAAWPVDHEEMRSIRLASSSGARELFARFDTGHCCSKSSRAGLRAIPSNSRTGDGVHAAGALFEDDPRDEAAEGAPVNGCTSWLHTSGGYEEKY